MTDERRKENPHAVLSAITASIARNLLMPSSFLPRAAHRKLIDIVTNGFHILSEDEYVALRVPRFAYSKFPESVEQTKDSARRGLPVYISPIPGRPEGIYMTEPWLVNGMDDDNKFPIKGLLEECAHAFSQTVIIPVTELPDGSIKMHPWKNKDELYEALRIQRLKIFDIDERVDPQQIRAATTGFRTEYYDTATEGGWTSVLSSPLQVYSEEARALIVQSVFAAKLFGAILRPYGDTRQQLQAGYKYVRDPKNLPAQYQMSHAGTLFVQNYIGNRDIVDKSKELLVRMYAMDSDDFVQQTSAQFYRVFVEVVSMLAQQKGQITG